MDHNLSDWSVWHYFPHTSHYFFIVFKSGRNRGCSNVSGNYCYSTCINSKLHEICFISSTAMSERCKGNKQKKVQHYNPQIRKHPGENKPQYPVTGCCSVPGTSLTAAVKSFMSIIYINIQPVCIQLACPIWPKETKRYHYRCTGNYTLTMNNQIESGVIIAQGSNDKN